MKALAPIITIVRYPRETFPSTARDETNNHRARHAQPQSPLNNTHTVYFYCNPQRLC